MMEDRGRLESLKTERTTAIWAASIKCCLQGRDDQRGMSPWLLSVRS